MVHIVWWIERERDRETEAEREEVGERQRETLASFVPLESHPRLLSNVSCWRSIMLLLLWLLLLL